MGYHIRVKICGVTSEAEARQIADLGADAIGLNFHPGSPRVVDDLTAGRIVQTLPAFVEPVAVCVDVHLRKVIERLAPLRMRTVQMHGVLPEASACGESRPWSFVPAFAVRGPEDLERIREYVSRARPAAVLVDGHAPGLHGGTGKTAPWDLLADFQAGVPLILAGGLTPDNVAEAVRRVRPSAVDVASGVESAPGRKDLGKVKRFIEEARAAARSL
jgi:phosphoribosylanthranilate isomerase